MFGLDAVDLARFQFAFTVSYHIVFPALSIGLASFLMALEALWLKTGNEVYHGLYRFWIRIFAVGFGLGVVSGVVMAYEFGTNWSVFAQRGGDITGVLLTYEVLTAFFLEAGFLGVMLFGENRVNRTTHFLATCMVAVGTLISATWILISNSWMQTPAGYHLVDGHFLPADWFSIIFNPSFPYRFVHMVLAAFISVSFLVAGVGGYHLLRNSKDPAARTMVSMAVWMAVVAVPIQIVAGDMHGLNTLRHQPAKLAAMEGHWQNEPGEGVPLALVGWPDMSQERNRFSIEIPHVASLYLTHTWGGQIKSLKDFPADERPDVPLVFWTFRIMVGIGMLMLLTGLVGSFLRWRGKLFTTPLFLRWITLFSPAGFIALIAGWVTTEAGRQPWVVYGLMRTVNAHSPLSFGAMAASLTGFIVVYAIIFAIGIYYILKLIRKEPQGEMPSGGPGQNSTPKRPFSATLESFDD
ncbi:cytochrome ubiquinol oxidase subunit I [Carnimonas bestiolae]|uniref:cytochrome ubiquinol oxidase subunit I n=1 Tax=Carnimonas bestiolae TaxID=3402172 RepID=UPI003EDC1701